MKSDFKKRILSTGLAAALVLSSAVPAYSADTADTGGTGIENDMLSVTDSGDGLVVSYNPGGQIETETEALTEGNGVLPETDGLDAIQEAGTEPESETGLETESESESETEEVAGESYIVYLPAQEGIKYLYDENAYDGDLSGDDYSVLVYEAGDEVKFQIEGCSLFELVDAETEEEFTDAVIDGGNVSFIMPETDIAVVAITTSGVWEDPYADVNADAVLETQTAADIAETEAVTEEESGPDADAAGETEEDVYVIDTNASAELSITTDKESYHEGETAVVTVKADPGFIIDDVSAESTDPAEDAVDMELVDEVTVGKADAQYLLNLEYNVPGLVTEDVVGASEQKFEIVMPASDISLDASVNGDIMLIAKDLPESYNVTVADGMASLPSNLATLGPGGANYANTYIKKVTFTEGNDSFTCFAYCIQPYYNSPPANSKFEMSKIAKDNLVKAMYYMYGGPGWETSELKTIATNAGCTTPQHYYALTHYVASYIYLDGKSWNFNSSMPNVVNSTGVALVQNLVARLDKLPYPSKASLSKSEVEGKYNEDTKNLVTESITFNAMEGATATITAGANVTIYNETTNKHKLQSIKLHAGDTFHLEGPVMKLRNKERTYDIDCDYPVDFQGLKFQVKGYQDIGVGYRYSKGLSLKVKWDDTEEVFISVTKQLGDTGLNNAISAAYPFTGAEYTVYSDQACTTAVGTISIDENGAGTVGPLQKQSYWVRETTPPPCGAYDMDQETHEANEANEWTIVSQEPPRLGTLNIRKSLKIMETMTEEQKQELYDSRVLEKVEFKLEHENAANLGRYGFKSGITCDRYGNATVPELICGNWKISEVKTPSTYYRTMPDDIINIVPGQSTYEYGNTNVPYEGWIQLEKKDAETGKVIIRDHATFQLYRFDDLVKQDWVGPISLLVEGDTDPTDTFTTNKNGYVRFGQALSGGRYKLVEIDPPLGYEVMKEGIEFQITTDNNESSRVSVDIPEPHVEGYIQVTKFDDKTGKHCGAGYTFNVYAEEDIIDGSGEVYKDGIAGELIAGTLVDTIVTDENGVATSRMLRSGKYYVQEAGVPGDGHTLNPEKYPFEVSGEANNNEPWIIEMEIANGENRLQLVKTDSHTGNPLAGITFRVKIKGEEDDDSQLYVTDKDGKLSITGLSSGDYTVQEVKTLPGYNLNDDVIEFTVDEDCLINGKEEYQIEAKNVPNEVHISKKDITNGEPVPGATLRVTDADGNVVDEWVSTDEEHVLWALPAGTYTLTETLPPEQYELSSSVQFTVKDSLEVQKAEMLDRPYREVEISKKDVTNGEELPGAHLVLQDEAGNVVDEWDSTTEPHKLPLHSGKYTLTETKPADGYVTAESIEFEVLERGEGDMDIQHVDMFDDVTKAEISKQDMTGGEEIPGAHLEIHNEAGDLVDEWVSEEEPHYIEKLPIGKYTLTETLAPDGYVTSETVEFEILDTAEVQSTVMHDDVTKVEISKQDVTNGSELPGAHLVIKDEDGETVEEWTSTTEPHYIEMLPVGKYTLTEIQAPEGYDIAETVDFEVLDDAEIQHVVMYDSPTPVPVTPAPQTGDDFNVVQLAVILAAAVVLLAAAAVLIVKSRKPKNAKAGEKADTKDEGTDSKE